jgi:hypothetical protein
VPESGDVILLVCVLSSCSFVHMWFCVNVYSMQVSLHIKVHNSFFFFLVSACHWVHEREGERERETTDLEFKLYKSVGM